MKDHIRALASIGNLTMKHYLKYWQKLREKRCTQEEDPATISINKRVQDMKGKYLNIQEDQLKVKSLMKNHKIIKTLEKEVAFIWQDSTNLNMTKKIN